MSQIKITIAIFFMVAPSALAFPILFDTYVDDV